MTFTPIIPSSYQEDRVELIAAIQALIDAFIASQNYTIGRIFWSELPASLTGEGPMTEALHGILTAVDEHLYPTPLDDVEDVEIMRFADGRIAEHRAAIDTRRTVAGRPDTGGDAPGPRLIDTCQAQPSNSTTTGAWSLQRSAYDGALTTATARTRSASAAVASA